jgi:hypothetical protein
MKTDEHKSPSNVTTTENEAYSANRYAVYAICGAASNSGFSSYENAAFKPIQAGALTRQTGDAVDETTILPDMLHDTDGTDTLYKALDAKNDDERKRIYHLFSEFTAVYWVWKNTNESFVGVSYDNKQLDLGFLQSLREDEYIDYDAVIVDPNDIGEEVIIRNDKGERIVDGEKYNLATQYKNYPHPCLDALKDGVQKYWERLYDHANHLNQAGSPETDWANIRQVAIGNVMNACFDENWASPDFPLYFGCQICAKREIFDEYCEFVFFVLTYIYENYRDAFERIDRNKYPEGDERILAHMAERLYSMYCYYLTQELPRYQSERAEKNVVCVPLIQYEDSAGGAQINANSGAGSNVSRYGVYAIRSALTDGTQTALQGFPSYENSIVKSIQAGALIEHSGYTVGETTILPYMLHDTDGDHTLYKALNAKTDDERKRVYRLFSEFTATYWVWKNAPKEQEFIGISHYSRLFNLGFLRPPQINDAPMVNPRYRNFDSLNFCRAHGMTSETIAMWLEPAILPYIASKSFDAIIINPLDAGEEIVIRNDQGYKIDPLKEKYNLAMQYRNHPHPCLGVLKVGIETYCNALGSKSIWDRWTLSGKGINKNVNADAMKTSFDHCFNEAYTETNFPLYFKCQILARREIFEEYCEFTFFVLNYIYKYFKDHPEILDEINKKAANGEGDNRLLAYMGERLCAMYCYYLDQVLPCHKLIPENAARRAVRVPVTCYKASPDRLLEYPSQLKASFYNTSKFNEYHPDYGWSHVFFHEAQPDADAKTFNFASQQFVCSIYAGSPNFYHYIAGDQRIYVYIYTPQKDNMYIGNRPNIRVPVNHEEYAYIEFRAPEVRITRGDAAHVCGQFEILTYLPNRNSSYSADSAIMTVRPAMWNDFNNTQAVIDAAKRTAAIFKVTPLTASTDNHSLSTAAVYIQAWCREDVDSEEFPAYIRASSTQDTSGIYVCSANSAISENDNGFLYYNSIFLKFKDGQYKHVGIFLGPSRRDTIFVVEDPEVGSITTNAIDICDWEGNSRRIQMFDFYPLPADVEKRIADYISGGRG